MANFLLFNELSFKLELEKINQKLYIMKKKSLKKLKINKNTVSGVGNENVQGGRPPASFRYSNCNGCQPPVKHTDDCPFSIPHTLCICTGDQTYFDETCGACY
jgi:hypothetical protein